MIAEQHPPEPLDVGEGLAVAVDAVERLLAGGADRPGGAVGGDEDEGEGRSPLAALDPDKVKPELLERLGTMLQDKAAALQSTIAEWEKEFLEQNPPS